MARTISQDRTLHIESLEDRCTPALTILFDYTFDDIGFFSDPARRAALERVGTDLAGRIDSTPAAITPGGNNYWTASFFHPATGEQIQVNNLAVPTGALTVFVGARNLPGGEAGQGGYGGYGWQGLPDWGHRVSQRGLTGFATWGGSLTFDTDKNWYFEEDASGLRTGLTDFYSVAAHELGHLLGLGTAPAFDRLIVNGTFTGSHAVNVYGSAPPVSPDEAHWANGVSVGGQPASLQPFLVIGQRYGLSPLDYAALADIGWQVSSLAPTSPPASEPPTDPVTPSTPPASEAPPD